ncbi:hypothetical protein [Peptostreptococcus sp. D1]|uniref:hypothetical protein n=1 Tax=Peptostreptococcus sp. D1 TaxID=72304 RepID=UPI0008E44A84|nr:hypothetical protein [Peptostreptococcus sp. D1]SFE26567.1 hypothetical protein SAMN02910278_00470 [Peptostreptococcus sp. D1]
MKTKIFLTIESRGYEICYITLRKGVIDSKKEFFPFFYDKRAEGYSKNISISIVDNIKKFEDRNKLKVKHIVIVESNVNSSYKTIEFPKLAKQREIRRVGKDEIEANTSDDFVCSLVNYKIKKEENGYVKYGIFSFDKNTSEIIKYIEKYGKIYCKEVYLNFQVIQYIISRYQGRDDMLVVKDEMTILEIRNTDSVIYSIIEGVVKNTMVIDAENYSDGIINYLNEQSRIIIFGSISDAWCEIIEGIDHKVLLNNSENIVIDTIIGNTGSIDNIGLIYNADSVDDAYLNYYVDSVEKSYLNEVDSIEKKEQNKNKANDDYIKDRLFSSYDSYNLKPINILKRVKRKENVYYKVFINISIIVLVLLFIEFSLAYRENVKLSESLLEKNDNTTKIYKKSNKKIKGYENIYGVDVRKIISFINYLNGRILSIKGEYNSKLVITFYIDDSDKFQSFFDSDIMKKVKITSINIDEIIEENTVEEIQNPDDGNIASRNEDNKKNDELFNEIKKIKVVKKIMKIEIELE